MIPVAAPSPITLRPLTSSPAPDIARRLMPGQQSRPKRRPKLEPITFEELVDSPSLHGLVDFLVNVKPAKDASGKPLPSSEDAGTDRTLSSTRKPPTTSTVPI